MMRKVTENEINRIRTCNARIRNENHLLRCTLRNISADPYTECSKVLTTVIDHCTKKKTEPKSGGHDCPPCCVCCPDPCYPSKCKSFKPKITKPCPPVCSSPPRCFSLPCSTSRYPPPRSLLTKTKKPCCKPLCNCCCTPPSLSFKKLCKKHSTSSESQPCCKPSIKCCPTKRPCSPCSHSSRSYSSHSYLNRPRCSLKCPSQRSYSPKLSTCCPTPSVKSQLKCCCGYCIPNKTFSLARKNFCSNNDEEVETSVSNNNKEPSPHENESATTIRPSAKILGELAFQLERRILDYVFGMEGAKRRRFYGYTVNNICHMMSKESKNICGNDDPVRKSELAFRLKKLLIGLKKVGYDIKVHGDFAQQMVNTYGLLPCPPDACTIEEFGLHNPNCITSLIEQLACNEEESKNLRILLSSLKYLSKCDGRPLFVW